MVKSGARIHLRNLAFNWGGHAATLVVMFFLSPYIVGKLDAVTFGIWSLLNVLTGYMGVFDLGVRSSVGRHIALYLGKKDERGVDETIRAGFGLFTLTGLLILLVGILIGWLFPEMFKGVPPEHFDTVRFLLPLMVVNVWLSAIAAIYSSVLSAHDRFDVARGVDLVVLVIRTVATVYALHMGWGLWGLVMSLICGNFCATIGNRIYAGIYHADLRSLPFLYSRQRFKELFGYGFYSFISSSSVKIIGQSDLVIVGIVLSVAAVREYSVGAMLVYYSATFILMISGTFFPAVQRSVSGEFHQEVRQLLFNQLRISFCAGILVYIGFVIYSQPFIRLWMLQDGFDITAVTAAATVMTILAIAKLPSLYIIPCQSVLAAMGHVRFNASLAMLEAVTNVLLSLLFVLILGWGLAGVAAGTLVARLLLSSVWVPLYLCRKVDIPFRKFFGEVILPGALATGIFSLACMLFVHLLPPLTWAVFITHIVAACLTWCLIVSMILLTRDMRQRISANCRSLILKLSLLG